MWDCLHANSAILCSYLGHCTYTFLDISGDPIQSMENMVALGWESPGVWCLVKWGQNEFLGGLTSVGRIGWRWIADGSKLSRPRTRFSHRVQLNRKSLPDLRLPYEGWWSSLSLLVIIMLVQKRSLAVILHHILVGGATGVFAPTACDMKCLRVVHKERL